MVRKMFSVILCFSIIILQYVSGKDVQLSDCHLVNNGSCYIFSMTLSSFHDAYIFCNSLNGAELATIPDENTMDLLQRHEELVHGICNNEKKQYWIGLATQESYSERFSFAGGRPLFKSDYQPWAPNQPARIHEKACVSVDIDSSKWYANPCYSRLQRSICELKGKNCNINNVIIPKAIFENCYKDKEVMSGTVVDIKCPKEQGTKQITCKLDGNWTTFPNCTEKCAFPILPSHASVSLAKSLNGFNVGSKAFILCDPGYVVENEPIRSHFDITCTKGGKWTNVLKKCVAVKSHALINVRVAKDEPLSLNCNLPLLVNATPPQKEDWLWQKNSEAVKASEGYLQDTIGRLHIEKFTENHQGIYSCFVLQPTNIAGIMSYDVQFSVPCSKNISTNTQRKIAEGRSAILNCPHQTTASVNWVKDGQPIYPNDRITITADGTLIFTTVLYSDQGIYTCVITSELTTCSANKTVNLFVMASAESVCGAPDMINSNPWTVSLWIEEENAPFCYGVLIHELWVLTSAYCVSGFYRRKTLSLLISLGEEWNINGKEKSNRSLEETENDEKVIPAASIKIHPKYSRRLFANDLALIKLQHRVHFSKKILPVCLNDKDVTVIPKCNQNPQIFGMVSGWGSLETSYLDESFLKNEQMVIESQQECQKTDTIKFTNTMICATGNMSESAIFAADLGSPLVTEHEGRVRLLGIYVVGERFSYIGNHDYFTKIFSFLPWIKSHVHTK